MPAGPPPTMQQRTLVRLGCWSDVTADAIRAESIDRLMPADTSAIQVKGSLNSQGASESAAGWDQQTGAKRKARFARAFRDNRIRLFLILVAGSRARTADRHPIGSTPDAHVSLGLRS
jgi:hypothetical protein